MIDDLSGSPTNRTRVTMETSPLFDYKSPLEKAIEAAQSSGWVAVDLSIEGATRLLGKDWEVVPPSPTENPVSTLRPTEPNKAPTRSLSAIHGSGRFPLHTDGAHMDEPPDIIILESENPTTVATRLLSFDTLVPDMKTRQSFAHGIFCVLRGKASFYTSAYTMRRLRYDAGCMKPCDQRSRSVSERVAQLESQAVQMNLTGKGSSLVIDNRLVLHGREDASDEWDREVRRLMLRKRERR